MKITILELRTVINGFLVEQTDEDEFRAFQATRRYVDDISSIVDFDTFSGPAYVYDYFVEAGEDPAFILVLDDGTFDDTISDPFTDLEDAEKSLYHEVLGR